MQHIPDGIVCGDRLIRQARQGLTVVSLQTLTGICCMVASSTPISSQQPAKLKLLQVVRLALRRHHYSYRTE